MKPEILVRVDPEVPLVDRYEDRRLSDGVRVEVMKLHPVVVRERSHKAARHHPEPMLVEWHEAKDVDRGRGQLLVIPRHKPFGGVLRR
jgi:hypothetical protein